MSTVNLKGDTEAAAVWLTENAKVESHKKEDLKITKVEVSKNLHSSLFMKL